MGLIVVFPNSAHYSSYLEKPIHNGVADSDSLMSLASRSSARLKDAAHLLAMNAESGLISPFPRNLFFSLILRPPARFTGARRVSCPRCPGSDRLRLPVPPTPLDLLSVDGR